MVDMTALERVRRYVAVRAEKPMRQLGDEIHGVHTGTQWEASLSLQDLEVVMALVDGGTPAARWRDKGEPDPHGNRYACDRAKLILGNMTDDEVANAVYLDPSIVNLTAAKDRIRWLSRALEAANAR